MQQSPSLPLSPSLNSYSSGKFAEIAAEVSEEFIEESEVSVPDNKTEDPPPEYSSNDQPPQERQQEEEEEVDDFEFTFACRNPDDSPISADEIFYNGQIRPVYPIFNRDLLLPDGQEEESKPANPSSLRLTLGKLLLEERDPPSSSSSEVDELEGIPAGTYCVWRPKTVPALPERCKKSNSTGSSRRWRFRDLLHRSNSEGKDTFVFLTPSNTFSKSKKSNEKTEKPEVPKEKTDSSSEVKVAGKVKAKGNSGEGVSAHEIHYVRNRALKKGDRRRSFLPYRQDLVGFFANVNGLSRNLHPF